MYFAKNSNVVTSDLYLTYLVSQGNLLCPWEWVNYQEDSIHQIMLCLNMTEINYSGSDSQSFDIRCVVALNRIDFLPHMDSYSTDCGGWRDSCTCMQTLTQINKWGNKWMLERNMQRMKIVLWIPATIHIPVSALNQLPFFFGLLRCLNPLQCFNQKQLKQGSNWFKKIKIKFIYLREAHDCCATDLECSSMSLELRSLIPAWRKW